MENGMTQCVITAFMLFRELLEKSKGSLFDIHCGMWTSIND